MERTGFGGSCRCSRLEVKEKVWVNVDLAAADSKFKSLSECVCGHVVYIRAIINGEEIFGQGRNRAEAIETAFRRYLL